MSRLPVQEIIAWFSACTQTRARLSRAHWSTSSKLHVVELDAVIGHEHLDGGMTRFHQLRHVIPQRRLGRIGDDHVEGVVDHRALLGERVIGIDDLVELHADVLGGERDHRGGAAERSRHGRALEGVGIENAGRRDLLDMGVTVDAAGQHQLAAHVDVLRARPEIAADRRDRLALDRHIGREHRRGGGDGAAAQDEVVGLGGHGRSPAGTSLSGFRSTHPTIRCNLTGRSSRERLIQRAQSRGRDHGAG